VGDILAGIVVAGILLTYALLGRRQTATRSHYEEQEKRAIERQGELLARQAELAKPHTDQEAADEVNRAFTGK
jgi:hypothetical protein